MILCSLSVSNCCVGFCTMCPEINNSTSSATYKANSPSYILSRFSYPIFALRGHLGRQHVPLLHELWKGSNNCWHIHVEMFAADYCTIRISLYDANQHG